MRSYVAAREFLGFLSFVAWCVIILGVVFAFGAGSAVSQTRGFGVGGGAMAGMMAALPGLILAFLGFLGLVLVQLGRAGIDTAEYTQQMLKIARDQLDVSQQALRSGVKAESGFTALNSRAPESIADDPVPHTRRGPEESQVPTDGATKGAHPISDFSYRGRRVRVANGKYQYNGMSFSSAEAVKGHLDQQDGYSPKSSNRPYANQLGVNPAAVGDQET